MRVFLFFLALFGFVGYSAKIEHVVVLAMENRSFDHIMGFLKRNNSKIDGCLPDSGKQCSNPLDPLDPTSQWFPVTENAAYVQVSDPNHSFEATLQQVYGYQSDSVTVPPMTGFVRRYQEKQVIMDCFPPEQVPAMATLASEFAIFDRWYAAVPGPTEVNRLYLNSATSHGSASNDNALLALGYPQKTIFESMDESSLKKNWSVYFELAPTTLFFKYTRRDGAAHNFHAMDKFYTDAAIGNLTNYVFLEPRYFEEGPNRPADDQHPDHDVGLGDALFKKVYEALRNGPLWNKTLFIITYDEHGGFFDHVPPPTDCPNPDGLIAHDCDPPFDFTRLGVRVPTLMISPWIKKGTVVGEPVNGTHFEHSSIPATLRTWFAPDRPFLTKRDAWAADFSFIVEELTEPRTDCPTVLPAPVTHRRLSGNFLPRVEEMGNQPIHPEGFTHNLLKLCGHLGEGRMDVDHLKTESVGHHYCETMMERYFAAKKKDFSTASPKMATE